jgi:hypothetical protein
VGKKVQLAKEGEMSWAIVAITIAAIASLLASGIYMDNKREQVDKTA